MAPPDRMAQEDFDRLNPIGKMEDMTSQVTPVLSPDDQMAAELGEMAKQPGKFGELAMDALHNLKAAVEYETKAKLAKKSAKNLYKKLNKLNKQLVEIDNGI